MNLQRGCERPFAEIKGVGIAFACAEFNHVGILYRRSDTAYICHLLGHYVFRNEEMKEDRYFWGECDWISPTLLPIMVSRLITLKSNTKISYGIFNDVPCFDELLSYSPVDIGKGLTCASFVLGIFEALKLKILNCESWERRSDDEEWQRLIIDYVQIYDASQAEAMKKHVGAFRYRPEEVAAAALSPDRPLNYIDATSRAQVLLEIVKHSAANNPNACGDEEERSSA